MWEYNTIVNRFHLGTRVYPRYVETDIPDKGAIIVKFMDDSFFCAYLDHIDGGGIGMRRLDELSVLCVKRKKQKYVALQDRDTGKITVDFKQDIKTGKIKVT